MANHQGNSNWLLTCFNGNLDTNLRQTTWNLLKEIRPIDQSPWMVVGDFNKILHHDKNFGGKQRSERLMQDFQMALDYCSLFYLGFRGDSFTWSNKNMINTFTKERLDRAVTNQS